MRNPGSEPRALDLLVLGEINPDIVVAGRDPRPKFGQRERLVETIELTVGSSSAIVAAGAARLGLRVALVGVVGDDPFGRFMLAELTARDVDVSACRIDRGRPTGASVILAQGTDRAILTATGTITALHADDVPAELIAGSRHLHVGSYYLQTGLRGGLPGLLEAARTAGTTISIDPNWDPDGRWDAGLQAVLSMTDVFLPNDAEARHISGHPDVAAAALALVAGGPDGALVVVKCGADGALAASRDGLLVEVPAYPVAPVDTIGAGDAFDAGFLVAWLDRQPLRDALAFAAVCGALSTRGVGGTASQATRGEADAALAGWRRG